SYIIFAGVDMPAARGIPAVGECVLGQGTALEINLARFVENQNMHRPVLQPLGMDNLPFFLGNDPVRIVDDVEDLLQVVRHGTLTGRPEFRPEPGRVPSARVPGLPWSRGR